MDDVTVKSMEQVEPYSGPHAIEGIRFRAMRAALGVSAWGMNVLEIDAGCEGYPEHDHAKDGQEEVYVILKGSAKLCIGDDERVLAEGDFARVPAELKRKILPGERGVTLLAIGATPGKPFAPTIDG